MPYLRANGDKVQNDTAGFLLSQESLTTATELSIELGEEKNQSTFLQETGRTWAAGA